MYVDAAFPLPLRQLFTYSVPPEFEDDIAVGKRIAAPLGKRILTGFIVAVRSEANLPAGTVIHEFSEVLDTDPLFDEAGLAFYQWLSDFYLCSQGEALALSDPIGSEVQSQRKIVTEPAHCAELLLKEEGKSTPRKKLLELFSQKEMVSLRQAQDAAGKKDVYAVIRSLEKAGAVTVYTDVPRSKVNVRTEKFIRLKKSKIALYTELAVIEKRSKKQFQVLLYLLEKTEPEPMKRLLSATGASAASVTSLKEKGYIEIIEQELDRSYKETYSEDQKKFRLTAEQEAALEPLKGALGRNRFEIFLLYGVTGSGKTQVYLELVDEVLASGKSALILVPEISLTPQMTARLYRRFGDTVAVLHSRMGLGEHFDSWRKIASGKARVVTGPRSALFAPLRNIGIIIVDEEHDTSYKSDKTPRYQARDAAIKKAQLVGCPVLLGSATPSVESMHNAAEGKYRMLTLGSRVDDAMLPDIVFVNMVEAKKQKRAAGVFSSALLDKIEDRIKKKEGIILLQNRRGFSTEVFCPECGEREMCSECSVSLVFHIATNDMHCHYCGLVRAKPKNCSHCGSEHIIYTGTGTERVEDELALHFPNAVMKRIDSDTMQRKGELSETLTAFRNAEIDILIGTQMVSKGLDFPRVTLVGVISAETNLWMPDFRADERTYQLLTQVSGRAGRSALKGEVFIQTQNDTQFVLQVVKHNDAAGFYSKEFRDRQTHRYPPYYHLCLIEVKDKDEALARKTIEYGYSLLYPYRQSLSITPPTRAVIYRIKGEFRYHIIVRTNKTIDKGAGMIRAALTEMQEHMRQHSQFRSVRLILDMNPYSVL